jgi:hypothetical protein
MVTICRLSNFERFPFMTLFVYLTLTGVLSLLLGAFNSKFLRPSWKSLLWNRSVLVIALGSRLVRFLSVFESGIRSAKRRLKFLMRIWFGTVIIWFWVKFLLFWDCFIDFESENDIFGLDFVELSADLLILSQKRYFWARSCL